MTEKTLTCDVLIVGGGPAGLSVAATLPDDVKTVVVHQDAEIGLPIRTSGVSWSSDVEKLGIPPEMCRVLDVAEAFSDRAHAVLPIEKEVPVMLDTPVLYKWLAAMSDHKDRTLLLSTKFLTTRQRDDGLYESEIRSRSSDVERVVSKYIVDGSGWHFAVLSALGLRQKPERLGVGTEYEYPLGNNQPNRTLIFVGRLVPSGYGWVFPSVDGKIRIGVGVIQPDTDASPRKLLDAVVNNEKLLKRFGVELEGPPKVHSGILPSVPYDDELVFGNVIRVGDSANFATPTLGEGIRICIELGWDLGEQLGRSVKTGRAAPLKAYERKARRQLKRSYKWGFLVNSRMASFTPQHWNASVRRMSSVGSEQLTAMMRNEFSNQKIARMSWNMGRMWLRRKLGLQKR